MVLVYSLILLFEYKGKKTKRKVEREYKGKKNKEEGRAYSRLVMVHVINP